MKKYNNKFQISKWALNWEIVWYNSRESCQKRLHMKLDNFILISQWYVIFMENNQQEKKLFQFILQTYWFLEESLKNILSNIFID